MPTPLSTTIPLRFILTIGHFIAMLLVFWHKPANIMASFTTEPTSSQYDDANRSITAALGLNLICFFFHFVGILSGVSLFSGKMTFLQMVAQFFGGVLTAWFIIDKWQYGAYWYLWGFCSFIPAVAELTLLVLTFGFKYVEY